MDKVLPTDGVLVGAEFSVWSRREGEEIGTGISSIVLI